MLKIYSKIKEKDKRTIKRELSTILSHKKGLSFPKSKEEYLELGFFQPTYSIDGNKIYLSKSATTAIRKICSIIYDISSIASLLTFNDIFQSIKKTSEHFLSNNSLPDDQEFLNELEIKLSLEISEYTYFCRIEGLDISESKRIDLGNKSVEIYNYALIENITCTDEQLRELITNLYSSNVVIIGTETGSSNATRERFYHHCTIYIAILKMYSCILIDKAISTTDIYFANDGAAQMSCSSTISWNNLDKSLIVNRSMKNYQAVDFTNEALDLLEKECFLSLTVSLVEKVNKTEIEDSVVKAIYWFGEAHSDKLNASKWLKLWTSLECFFTLENDEIIESNAKGIASILLYGGYQLEKYADYTKIKSQIKNYYVQRSKIVHRAIFDHISNSDLNEFSQIVAWVIIAITSLIPRGYTKLIEVKNQANRLDKLGSISKKVKTKI